MRRTLGWIAMVVGVLGALVCLLAVVAIWVGHNAAQAQVRGLAIALDGPLGVAAGRLADAEASLGGIESRVGALRARAETLAENPAAGEQARAELLRIVDNEIGASYTALRERYVAARDQSAAIIGVRNRLAALPGVRRSTDSLVAQVSGVDTRLQEVDERLVALREGLEMRDIPVNQAAARLARQAGSLEDSVAGFGATLGTYTAGVHAAQASLPALAADSARVITWLAVGLTVAALYGVLLHVALFLLGRIWARELVATPAASTVPPLSPEQ